MIEPSDVDDLEGAVKPKLLTCNGKECHKHTRCRRYDPISPLEHSNPAICQWYYPAYYVKDKPMSMRQEPLPERTIAGKKWTMYIEFMGKNIICHAFIDEPKVQHSYGCNGTKDEAINGCVEQIERIYTKPNKRAEGG